MWQIFKKSDKTQFNGIYILHVVVQYSDRKHYQKSLF